MTRLLSRESWIGVGVTSLAVAAMAVDHLMGDDSPILEDPLTFAISALLCVALALIVFAWLVPRVKSAPAAEQRAATRAIALSVLAVIGIPLTFWLGLPFVLAGGGIALGLLGRRGERRTLALAGVVVGSLVIALGVVGYGAQFIDKLAS